MALTTPAKMLEECASHLNIYIPPSDIDRLANAVPIDVPWDEEGMEFCSGMVIGWDSCRKKK